MNYNQGVGSLDGRALIEMNNLAVGYFPAETREFWVYPPPVPVQPPMTLEQLPPSRFERERETSSLAFLGVFQPSGL